MKTEFFLQNTKFKKFFFLTILFFLKSFDLQAQTLDSSFYNWKIYEIIDDISSVGGALKAVEIGYQKQIIEKNAFLEIQRFENGDTKRIFSSDPIEVLNEDTDTSTAVEIEKLIYTL